MKKKLKLQYRPMKKPSEADVERFWGKVVKTPTCWLYMSSMAPMWSYFGYGKVSVCAHRFSLFLHTGKAPRNKMCCHRCPNRNCVNYKHLYWGTAQDNINDLWSNIIQHLDKGGKRKRFLRYLSVSDVKGIWNVYCSGGISHRELALMYGVTKTCIAAILSRKSWKRVTENLPGNPSEQIEKNQAAFLLQRKGIKSPMRRLKDEDVRDIMRRLRDGEAGYAIAKEYNLSSNALRNMSLGRTYKESVLKIGEEEHALLNVRKNRRSIRGERHPHARITEQTAIAIFLSYHRDHIPRRKVAAMYGLSDGATQKIIVGENWASITRPHHHYLSKTNMRPRMKLLPEQVKEIRYLLKEGLSQSEAARRYGVSSQVVSAIAMRRIWKHV